MAGIKDYRIVQANNTSLNGIDVAEGMLPSNLNNAIRALMANTREFYNDSQWVIYGDGDGAYTAAYASSTSFTINGVNVTSIYHAGRRIKLTAGTPGTIFGTISSSTFSTNTIVNVTWDSGSLSNEAISNVYISALSKTNTSIPGGVVGTTQLADSSVTSAKIANGTIVADDLASNAITTVKILNANVTTAKVADNAITTAKIADAAIITSSEQAGHTVNDTTFYTTKSADTRFLNKDTSELINSGQTWSSNDNFIATTAAIDLRVIDLVDDVGGFVPIANETSFPNVNPDVNNGVGTIVSVEALASGRTANSSGVITISNGTVGNSTVTLNGCGANAALPVGFGILVESTTTQHTYTFHRLVPKATEVSAVAAISSAITGVNNNLSAINTVNSNASNINTVSGAISNVNLTGGSIGSVNTTAANITGVNSFAARYRVGSSDPSASLDEGDLAYNTNDNNLKFYNGSSWTSIAPGIANVVDDSSPQLGGNLDLNSKNIVGSGGIPAANFTGTIANARYGTPTFNGSNLTALNGSAITSGTVANARLPGTITGKTLTTATVTGTINANTLTALGDGSSADGKIILNCSQNSHGVKIQAPPHSAGQSYTLTLPSSINNGQFLKTNGSGVLSFAAITLPVSPTVSNVSQTIAPASATTINIAGSNFSSIPSVEFIKSNTGAITSANTVSLTNGTTLAVNVTLAAGSYFVRVELDNGNAGRSTNAIITASSAPVFQTNAGSIGTYAGNFSGELFDIQGSSDSAVAFSETSSVLSGAGISLNTSNGKLTTSDFGGSSTTPTTYTFTLRLTDQEAQTTDRQFTITSSFGATGGGQFN